MTRVTPKCRKILIIQQVGDPAICTKISDELIVKYGHYVQAINYPTVPRGEEKLRIAPTPHHNRAMMDQFVADLVNLKSHKQILLLKSLFC